MPTLWFWLIGFAVAAYFALDGFDLGVGMAHLAVARTEEERRAALRTIGPVWDGNEVWLLVGGGTVFFTFPRFFASAMSGFYLPITIVIWLLILRGVALEFRSHLASPVWRSFWDATFAGSSLLLAFFFGAALGNIVRGVGVHADGFFFVPLWTDFRTGAEPGALDWYTVLVGAATVAALLHHGALWLVYKTEGPLRERARRIARRSWWGTAVLLVLVTVATFRVQPQVGENLEAHPAGGALPLIAAAGLVAAAVYTRRGRELAAFLASSVFIVGMIASAFFGLYPLLLPSTGDPTLALTITNSAASAHGLAAGAAWWPAGVLLAIGYFVFVYRHARGKVAGDGGHQGY